MLQVQEADCGAVALAIVLAHHGAWVPLPEIRERCGTTRFGTPATTLLQAATSFGLTARALRMDDAQLPYLPAPAILFWQQSHFLVLEGVVNNYALINDPAIGHRELTLAELAAGYSGIAFPMSPDDGFQPRGAAPSLRREARRLVRPAAPALAALALVVSIESVLFAFVARGLGGLIDTIPGTSAGNVWPVLLGMAAIAVAIVGQGLLTDRAIGGIARPSRRRLLTEMESLPSSFIELRRPEELGGRLRLPETAGALLASIDTGGVRLLVSGMAWLVVLSTVSWLVSLAFLAGLAAAIVVQARAAQQAAIAAGQQHRAQGRRIADVGGLAERLAVIQANGEETFTLASLVTTENPANVTGAKAIRVAWHDMVLPLAVGLPAVVAVSIAAFGSLTPGDLAIAVIVSFAVARLARIPASLHRDLATLPVVLRQLDDSHAEVAYRTGESLKTQVAA
jgi:ABC-type bacteriocin/lantibiotic exporter with double-glycine peptidase domain